LAMQRCGGTSPCFASRRFVSTQSIRWHKKSCSTSAARRVLKSCMACWKRAWTPTTRRRAAARRSWDCSTAWPSTLPCITGTTSAGKAILRTVEKIKLIHLLAKHGARWVPKDTSEINDARKSLLKLIPDYTVEFVWIMAKYKACSQPVIAQLLRTPTITKHVASFRERLAELTAMLKWGA
jgi:hypothetical protein